MKTLFHKKRKCQDIKGVTNRAVIVFGCGFWLRLSFLDDVFQKGREKENSSL